MVANKSKTSNKHKQRVTFVIEEDEVPEEKLIDVSKEGGDNDIESDVVITEIKKNVRLVRIQERRLAKVQKERRKVKGVGARQNGMNLFLSKNQVW